MLELTVPWEERIEEANERKRGKYQELVQECRGRGWKTFYEPIEVGCRGFAGRSLCKVLGRLGVAGAAKKRAIQAVSEAAEKATRWLWIKRADPWVATGTQSGPDHPRLGRLGISERNQSSAGSEPDEVRLVGKASHCGGTLEMKHVREWRPVDFYNWTLKKAAVVCEHLDCGSAVSVQERKSPRRLVSRPAGLQEYSGPITNQHVDSVRLLNGSSLCSGRLQVKSNQRWSSSPGKAAGLTCSEPVRLVGGASRCAGTLEVKHLGEWRPVIGSDGPLKAAGVFCEHLDCGSAVSMGPKKSSYRFVLTIKPDCFKLRSSLRECVEPSYSSSVLSVTCSDLLAQPSIIVPASMDGVSEAQQQGLRVSRGSSLTISCSIQPQFPGGSFQLTFTSSNAAYNYTQPAVNHSAHFLFPVTEPAHQGNYSCFYRVYVFSHNFSSESRRLSVTVSDPTGFIIRALVLPLILLLENVVLYFYCKASRGQKLGRRENNKLVNFGVGAAEEGPAEEEGAHVISR
ncbi:soluble scavenger receptor cysteine-rich domain-containing protein SSC5D-like [Neolamprologus brichardi]|uniref:soluble scavenger receptor cysteine-rich domain-containing protein SSC5D-like n=1 Tax=Neolamprologus brichardi TaxID=32507 RepID=UPI001643C616|nr:soluble scavenger receptor cysteine-rich domain-containing protein SSC5D-like [Neolamprologus brichardi]